MRRTLRFSQPAQLVLGQFVSAPSRWLHGYTLMSQLELSSGTLYPVLMRLAENGWLETRWDVPRRSGERPRHLYRLAPGAAAEARALLREWQTRGVHVPAPGHAT